MKDLMSFVVGLLGFGCAICGLLAEDRRPQRDDIILGDGGACVYPMSPTVPLGLVAAAMLLLAVSLVTRCCACCCRQRDGISNMSFGLGIFLAVLSWLMVLDTEFSFLIAVVLNWPGRRAKADECYTSVQAGNLFRTPGFNGMFATFFGIASEKILRPVASL